MPRYRHELRIRYGEVDLQGVVFNAHYLAYVDDAMDCWMRTLDPHFERFGWGMMLKRADIVWHRGAGIGDTLSIAVGVARWGRSSFDVGFEGAVDGDRVFTATVTYVGVKAGTTEPIPPPDAVRSLLGEPPDASVPSDAAS
ncbi:MAG: acyl-CoA thioesterase [Acidimicrobiales bacterium]